MSPQRPGDGDGGPEGPGDAAVGRGEDPVDVDAAWADIVARWGEPPADRSTAAAPDGPHGSGPRARGPQDRGPRGTSDALGPGAPGADGPGPARAAPGTGDTAGDTAADPAGEPGRGPGAEPAGWDDEPTAPRGAPAPPPEDEEHYVPPEPPRAPPADAVTRLAWLGALAGPALLLLCVLVWRDAPSFVVVAAVVAFVAGFGVLVSRLPRSRDDDDGAVV